jgi:hypothetical protein
MKTYRYFLLIAIVILVVSACAPTSTQNPPAPQPTAVSSSSSAEASTPTAPPSTKTDAEMEALIIEKTHDKHTLDFILSQNKTAEQWSATIDIMMGNGAKITPEEKTLIINWLVGRKNNTWA